MTKIIHIQFKAFCSCCHTRQADQDRHEYYTNLVAAFEAHSSEEIGISKATLDRVKEWPYETQKAIIRVDYARSTSDIHKTA